MSEVWSPAERELLALVLDRLVPAGRGFPAAGALGIGAYLEQVAGTTPAARRLFVEGLREIAIAGERIRPAGFAALSGDEQDSVLQSMERDHPAFFEALVRQTYSGYYSHPAVLALLGEDNPPQPHGHRIDPFANALVDRVRRSPFTYRQP
jgi:hypothetical protein